MPIFLSELPDVVLGNVIEKCDFRSILILRKVSRSLRNFIDDVKPYTGISSIGIVVEFNAVTFRIFTNRTSPEAYHIRYQHNEIGCSVSTQIFEWNQNIPSITPSHIHTPNTVVSVGPPRLPIVKKPKDRVLKEQDFVFSLLEDFKTIFDLQTSPLHEYYIRLDCLQGFAFPKRRLKVSARNGEVPAPILTYGNREPLVLRVLDGLNQILKCGHNLLKVEQLIMTARNHTQVLRILPFLDTKHLKLVHILNTEPDKKEGFAIQEITLLDQWKQTEIMYLGSFNLSAPIEHFSHFRKASFSLDSISCEDLEKLKEKFLGSSTFERFKVHFNHFRNKEKLIDTFGSAESGQEWYFWMLSIPGSNAALFLNVVLCYPRTICFTRCSQFSPPQKGCVNCVYV